MARARQVLRSHHPSEGQIASGRSEAVSELYGIEREAAELDIDARQRHET